MHPLDDILRRQLPPDSLPAQLAAVILAAGLSSRMGRHKPLLPLGGAPVLARVVELFQAAGAGQIVVVTGFGAADLQPLIASLGAQSVFNPAYKQDMYSSLRVGLAALRPDTRGFFLLPADMPLVRPATLVALAQSWAATGASLVQPRFGGRRGHPPLLGASLFAGLAAWPGQEGLRGFLASQAAPGLLVEVPDQGVLLDMDHPEDYLRLEQGWQGRQVPSPQEVEALLGPVLGLPPQVARHGQEVARRALALGQGLNQAGQALDLELLSAAGLLHGLAPTSHGGRLLRRWGWEPVAQVLEACGQPQPPSGGPLDEAQVLYLASRPAGSPGGPL